MSSLPGASARGALPLAGVRVLELRGLAPAPFCGMILGDFGADVVRVDRVYALGASPPLLESLPDPLSRGKRSICVNLRCAEGRSVFRALARRADVLIDPYRPGVLERLDLSPASLSRENPGLIIARLTGFGQGGAYERMAGHDINYIAMSGALALMGPRGRPPSFPLNILGDFAGGGMACAMGILLALLERARSGRGQTIDAAMLDGAAYLNTFPALRGNIWKAGPRGTNWLDGGAPYYNTYRTKDGKYVAVGCIEPRFFREFVRHLGCADADELLAAQQDRDRWPATRAQFAARFAEKTRDEWARVFDGTDACVTPVLEPDELLAHRHNRDRGVLDEKARPAPAPRLKRTPGRAMGDAIRVMGADTVEVLSQAGYDAMEIKRLRSVRAIGFPSRQRSRL